MRQLKLGTPVYFLDKARSYSQFGPSEYYLSRLGTHLLNDGENAAVITRNDGHMETIVVPCPTSSPTVSRRTKKQTTGRK